ncbi:MAG TPA: hypothetical protein VGB24_23515 [Longimicrobium sp.]|jgi:hypothetical protein|uniref:hypothetical protein n=1 Tax=Longimicrobium sp. TaxID=2029185 RepID=UPI002EDA2BDB
MTRHFAFALLLLAAVLPRPTKAQDMARALDALPQNSVVRLRGPELRPRRIQGRIGEVVGDTVFVRSGSRMIAVPIAGITRAEVAAGRNRVRGMLKGAGIGAGVGGVIGAALITAQCDNCDRSQHAQFGALGLGLGAICFAVPGGLVGLVIGTRDWEPVRHDGYRVGLAPAPDGRMGIGISLVIP